MSSAEDNDKVTVKIPQSLLAYVDEVGSNEGFKPGEDWAALKRPSGKAGHGDLNVETIDWIYEVISKYKAVSESRNAVNAVRIAEKWLNENSPLISDDYGHSNISVMEDPERATRVVLTAIGDLDDSASVRAFIKNNQYGDAQVQFMCVEKILATGLQAAFVEAADWAKITEELLTETEGEDVSETQTDEVDVNEDTEAPEAGANEDQGDDATGVQWILNLIAELDYEDNARTIAGTASSLKEGGKALKTIVEKELNEGEEEKISGVDWSEVASHYTDKWAYPQDEEGDDVADEEDEFDGLFKVVQSVDFEFGGVEYTASISDMSELTRLGKLSKDVARLARQHAEAITAVQEELSARGFRRKLTGLSNTTARVVTPTRTGGRHGATPDGVNPADVRAWAAKNGVEVNDKGRVPKAIVDQYLAAQR
ncbi:Lsr2 family DNA-binding protein (plasmid) [Streptomyces sp. BI20]|uniref:Lsr2 family DNA-binding protein n=1 Tax=Streptomyces sp. BI20 TaxID=3403460 RepID=UPI003C7423D4